MYELCSFANSTFLKFCSQKENKSWFERPMHLFLCCISGTSSNWRGHPVPNNVVITSHN